MSAECGKQDSVAWIVEVDLYGDGTLDSLRGGVATMSVRNMLGRVLLARSINSIVGSNTITLDRSDVIAAGSYLYSVQLGNKTAIEQMITID